MRGFDPDRLLTLRRAALLHDVGKLGVPTAILDKTGKLTEVEFAVIRLHPAYTQSILSMIHGFGRITDVASAHHERLDGRGYHRGVGADQLDTDMRIIAVADVFDALSANRPYRGALPLNEVFAIMEREPGALDASLVGLLKEKYMGLPMAA
jgi:HD-GYP domain-containing protein (c-di-GMP phosphodiesterase class II)